MCLSESIKGYDSLLTAFAKNKQAALKWTPAAYTPLRRCSVHISPTEHQIGHTGPGWWNYSQTWGMQPHGNRSNSSHRAPKTTFFQLKSHWLIEPRLSRNRSSLRGSAFASNATCSFNLCRLITRSRTLKVTIVILTGVTTEEDVKGWSICVCRLLVSASQDGKLIVWDSYTTNKVKAAK